MQADGRLDGKKARWKDRHDKTNGNFPQLCEGT